MIRRSTMIDKAVLSRGKPLAGSSMKAFPSKAEVRRIFNAMDARLDRAEQKIDAVLERQAHKPQ